MQLPVVGGHEGAGVVVRVGSGVSHLSPGDRVVAFASSCFASHVTTDAVWILTGDEGKADDGKPGHLTVTRLTETHEP